MEESIPVRACKTQPHHTRPGCPWICDALLERNTGRQIEMHSLLNSIEATRRNQRRDWESPLSGWTGNWIWVAFPVTMDHAVTRIFSPMNEDDQLPSPDNIPLCFVYSHPILRSTELFSRLGPTLP